MSGQGDRHKGARSYASGATKRKHAKEKKEKETRVLLKMSRMTDFMESNKEANTTSTQEKNAIVDEVTHKENEESQPGTSTSDEQQNPEPVDPTNDTEKNTEEMMTNADSADTENDIGKWPDHLSSSVVDYWIKKSSKDLQHCNENVIEQKSHQQTGEGTNRKCTVGMFTRRMQNGESINRSWMCFSPSTGRVYCFACKLMGAPQSQLTHGGFCDWRHASARLVEHETSKDHLQAILGLARRTAEIGTIDSDLSQQVSQVEDYWRSLLKRLVSVLTFLCERGLAIRGDDQIIGSVHNGNYLGLLELLSEYDDFLKHHIQKHANRGTGHTSYLSSTVCDELVEMMGKEVLENILLRLKKSKYYSISLDGTPDEGHIDQLTLIFRFIEDTTPVERFATFMPNQGHKAQEMFDGLLEFLDKHDIDINNCRGQSYDNASAMSGRFNGLQAKVAALNKLAVWIPCTAHSLNLVGKKAAECCDAGKTFFSFLEKLYVFFTVSTNRFKILTDKLCSANNSVLVPKRVTTTRWSCRADASKALEQGYASFKEALMEIVGNQDEKETVKCEAKGLYDQMCQLEMGIYTVFWNEVLDRANATSQKLQDPKIDLNTAVAALESLKSFINERRNMFREYEAKGGEKSGTTTYKEKRKQTPNVRRNPLGYGKGEEAQLSSSQKFKIEHFIPVIDQYVASLQERLTAYTEVCSLFGFLHHLDAMSGAEIEDAAAKLVSTYSTDLDKTLGIELVQFSNFLKLFTNEKKEDVSQEQFMYSLILEKGVQDTFPNVETMLRIFLVLMISNCSSERSFSKLKRIKNRLRTTMTQERLNHLTLMSSEHDILRQINFDELINDFASRKARKVPGL